MEAAHTILFNEQEIEQRVAELAQDISKDYAGKDVVAICILKGALIFFTDLVRAITVPVHVDFLQASSYGSGTVSSRTITITRDITTDIRGRHVLLIDTIIDTGETMACLYKRFSEQGPASLAIVGLLDKKPRRVVEVPITYKGFEIPDLFVVGYGMDIGEQYRNLPYIAVLDSAENT
jgi:hypoxanthine phosphoribosyltransferase